MPGVAKIQGALRAFDQTAINTAFDKIHSVIDNVSKLYGCSADIKITAQCPSLINNKVMIYGAHDLICLMFGRKKVFRIEHRGDGGSENFANFSRCVPSLIASVSAGSKRDGYIYTLHNPRVRFDERALSYGAALFASVGIYYAGKTKK